MLLRFRSSPNPNSQAISVLVSIGLLLALRAGMYYFMHDNGQARVPVAEQDRPLTVKISCSDALFPKNLGVIRRGMTYQELSQTLNFHLDEATEKTIAEQRIVSLWFQNPAKNTVEVELYDGRVSRAHPRTGSGAEDE